MKSLILLLLATVATVQGFSIATNHHHRSLQHTLRQHSSTKLDLMMDPSIMIIQQQQQAVLQEQQLPSTQLQTDIAKWSSSSQTVALQERKIPTKEEVEAKKRNFNVIFWGGGFVAPFLATIFYFGFDFWKK